MPCPHLTLRRPSPPPACLLLTHPSFAAAAAAVSLLPRIDQLWYKYIHMEEMLGNVAGARQIFERWMQWEPDHHGWTAYIKMELRYGETERARQIYERYVKCLPTGAVGGMCVGGGGGRGVLWWVVMVVGGGCGGCGHCEAAHLHSLNSHVRLPARPRPPVAAAAAAVKAWVRYAKFEMQEAGDVAAARSCYERAVDELGEEANNVRARCSAVVTAAQRGCSVGETLQHGVGRRWSQRPCCTCCPPTLLLLMPLPLCRKSCSCGLPSLRSG